MAKISEESVELLAHIGETLQASHDMESFLNDVLQRIMDLIDAEGGCSGVRAPEGILFRTYVRQGKAVHWTYCCAPGCGIPGWVLQTRAPYLTNRAVDDPHILRDVVERFEIHCTLCAPVLDREGNVVALFEIDNKQGGFSEFDKNMAVALCSLVSPAAENILVRQIREEESARIARDVHDRLGQELTALKLGLETHKAEVARRLEWLLGTVERSFETARKISRGIRSTLDEQFGIVSAIQKLIDDFGADSEIEIGFSVELESEPDPEITVALVGVLQEALTNVGRHARATRIDVLVSKKESNLILEVKDNGIGISEESRWQRESLGLRGMEERAASVGGELQVRGVVGQGTMVSVCVPWRPKRESQGHHGPARH